MNDKAKDESAAQRVQELIDTVNGLRLEVEGGRTHQSFLVDQVEALMRSVQELKKQLT